MPILNTKGPYLDTIEAVVATRLPTYLPTCIYQDVSSRIALLVVHYCNHVGFIFMALRTRASNIELVKGELLQYNLRLGLENKNLKGL